MKKIISSLKNYVVNNRRMILAIVFLSLMIYFEFLKYLEFFYKEELFREFMFFLTDDNIENYNIMFVMGFANGSILSVVIFMLCSWFSYSLSYLIFNLIECFKNEMKLKKKTNCDK